MNSRAVIPWSWVVVAALPLLTGCLAPNAMVEGRAYAVDVWWHEHPKRNQAWDYFTPQEEGNTPWMRMLVPGVVVAAPPQPANVAYIYPSP